MVTSQSKKIKVLEVIQTIGIGGAEMVVFNTTRFMDKSRFDVRVLVVGEGELVDRLRELGYEVDTFQFSKRYNWELVKCIRDLIKRHKIDIVQTHLARMNSYGFVASRLTHATNVMTVHGLSEFANLFGKLYYSLFGNFSGKIVTVSQNLAERFCSGTLVGKGKIAVIPNGIDIERFGNPIDREAVLRRFGVPADAKVVLAVGNIRQIKGYEFLINSFALIAPQDKRLVLLICGNDYFDYKKNLLPLVNRHGISGRVIFSDFVTDIETVYGVADVYALTSITEGFSLTTVEAMASRAAVVSTDCVGPREIIDDGVDGIIIAERDPELFGRTILELIQDDARRLSLGQAARRKVEEKYSIQLSVDAFARLFESLVK
jgi:glycosyltransferase involved in cell wall biosynthesis